MVLRVAGQGPPHESRKKGTGLRCAGSHPTSAACMLANCKFFFLSPTPHVGLLQLPPAAQSVRFPT